MPVLPEIELPTLPIIFVYPEELKTSKKVQVLRDFLVSKAAAVEVADAISAVCRRSLRDRRATCEPRIPWHAGGAGAGRYCHLRHALLVWDSDVPPLSLAGCRAIARPLASVHLAWIGLAWPALQTRRLRLC